MDNAQSLTEEQIRPFVLAAHSDLATVQRLYAEIPALLNARYMPFDETALEAAGHMGDRPIAEWLLAQGAPLTIFAAAMLGQVDAVRAFLAADPSLAAANGVHGISILYHAALSGNPAVADALVEYGGGAGTEAALHAAVQSGQLAMVDWLLARGVADVNPLNFKKATPYQAALAQGHTAIAERLAAAGGTAAPEQRAG
jgi:hypothetical protein